MQGYLPNVSEGVVPERTGMNGIPAASAALASTSESPTYTHWPVGIPNRPAALFSPSGSGL